LILAQRNCFISKKSPPGIFGASFLIGGSLLLVIGHFLCLELNSDIIQLAKEIGAYTLDGNFIYILSFIFSVIFLNSSIVLLVLALKGPLFIHRSLSAQPIIYERRKALVKQIVIVVVIPIAWTIGSFIIGVYISTSFDQLFYLIGMAIVYFFGSVVFGFIAGFISRVRTIVIDVASLLAIFHFAALIGTSYMGNEMAYGILWELALPWIGVYNTSICVFLFAYVVSRLRGFHQPALLQQT